MSIQDDTDRLAGQTLRGVYLVQEKIADGVLGAVYKAVHTALDAPFAVKVLRQDLHPDPSVVARFQREARALSRLRHPNVVAVTDFGQTEDGTLYVVMEYVTGKSLSRIIEEQAPLPEHRVVRIGAQILAALADAHARQVLHGALSPKDIMIEARRNPPDSVKVLDFGVAGIHLAGSSGTGATLSGAAPGLPAYLSPEQLVGGDLDARSDLYSVGVVLYEMLTKKLPVDANAAIARAARPGALPPRPSVHLPRPVSPDLEALVMRALEPHPYERPESAADMREELLRCRVYDATDSADDCGPTVVLPRASGERESLAKETPAPAPPPRAPPAGAAPRPTPARPTPGRSTPPRPAAARPTPSRPTPGRPTPGRPSPPEATQRTLLSPTRTARAASTLPRAVLEEVERRALAVLGPVAPFLVAKAGVVATSVEELCEIVASFIPSESDRKTFMAATGPVKRPATPRARDRARTPVAWDPALLDRAQRALAAHIGPVARVVVRRASAAARDPEHLVELLAREITDEAGRAAFLRAVEPIGHPR